MRTLSILLLLAASPLAGQQAQTPNTLTRAPSEPQPVASLADLAWLAGHWRGPGLGGVSEEVWTAPDGGSMMGMYRLIQDGAVVLYELMIVRPAGESLTLTLKHFNPDLTGWEQREEVREFPLVRLTPSEASFDGLTIRRTGPDSLEVFLAIRGQDGVMREEAFRYSRVDAG